VSVRRLPILAVFGGLLAAGLVIDQDPPPPSEVVFGTATAPVQPVASPETAATSTWFCPGVPAPPDGSMAGFVTISNPTGAELPARLTVVPIEGAATTRDLTLAPYATISINLAEVVPAAYVAAQVDIEGGGVVVEQSVARGEIRDPSACATAASPTWYLADGVTTRDARLNYFLYNPYPDDAIVDMEFATNEGPFSPQPLQGLVVRANSVRVVDITEQVRRRTAVAGTVTARSGRVVLGYIQTFDGSEGREGFTSGVAAPTAAGVWFFPDGRRVPQVSERVIVYNPGAEVAEIDIEMRPEAPDGDEADLLANVVPLSVAPFSAGQYDITGDVGVADGVHSIVVSSANGVPVVAQRVTNLVADEGTRGVSSMLGSRMAAARWLLATGGTSDAVVEEVTVLNTGDQPASVQVSRLEVDGFVPVGDALEVPAGGVVQLRVNEEIEEAPLTLLVEADAPLVVERGLIFREEAGTSRQLGVPVT
jgi:hypothetical protein